MSEFAIDASRIEEAVTTIATELLQDLAAKLVAAQARQPCQTSRKMLQTQLRHRIHTSLDLIFPVE